MAENCCGSVIVIMPVAGLGEIIRRDVPVLVFCVEVRSEMFVMARLVFTGALLSK